METETKSARFIRGIGPKRFEALNRLGVQTIRDLCYFFPRRYEDRAHFESIAHIQPGETVTVCGEVITLGIRPLKQGSIFELIVGDETGTLPAIWFHQAYLKNQFQVGDRIILSGKAERYQGRLQLSSPEYEQIKQEETDPIHTGRITPIYPLSEGLAQRSLRTAMKEVTDHYVLKEIQEFLPEAVRKKYSLVELPAAIQAMHFPKDSESLEAARRRVIFDEFFLFETILLSRIRSVQLKERAIPLQNSRELLAEFKHVLSFELTPDQEKVIHEIAENTSGEIPMNRLLEGEVGSGKTVVAAFFLFLAARSHLQGALLVPTEILAEQHYQTLKKLYAPLNISAALLTGSLEPSERENVRQRIKKGSVSIVVGTHALLQEEVDFNRLGLVVIDEQHRFGVRQRAKLVLKRPRPHLLVMTATPIPRTLGLTLYGDLDISMIRTLPKGRKNIKTYWISHQKEGEVFDHIRSRVLKKNEQAYILFPIIDEIMRPGITEKSTEDEEAELYTLNAATKEYERLRKGVFRDVPLGLVHGRLLKKERDLVMEKFHKSEIKILIATSVIEVGIDNPNVTCMVIENAERFGLSQLHQMRGRIGRGNQEASCFLFGNPTTEEGKRRLRIMTKIRDGFTIAEEDLILRGPGEFFGTKQSGIPFFQVASLIRDAELLTVVRDEVKQLLQDDADLTKPEHAFIAEEMNYRKNKF
ncbi:MAG: ATP-dependent DNA helicase RecG [Candidatus Omnitrophica bacterium]|nr:ATP-dependent DNA helicase RecG [Candidatus Omnitrophota bacterium]